MLDRLIIDLGTGYLKYGFHNQKRPKVMHACYKTTEKESGDPYLKILDPTRVGMVYPFENANLPDIPVFQPLLLEIFDRLSLSTRKLASIDIQLLVFSSVDQDRIYDVCDELRKVLGCHKMLAAYQQVLTLLLLEKHTGLVVDIGHSISLVTPIYKGFLLRQHVVDTATGSLYISAAIRQQLEVMAKEKNDSAYAKLATNTKAIEHIKRTYCQVLPALSEDTPKPQRYRKKGIDVSLGSVPWQAPEVLFDPSIIGVSDLGLPDAVKQTLDQVDVTMRGELANDIILTGGSSAYPGLRERFQRELKKKLSHLPYNVYALENAFTFAWAGAATLAQPDARLKFKLI